MINGGEILCHQLGFPKYDTVIKESFSIFGLDLVTSAISGPLLILLDWEVCFDSQDCVWWIEKHSSLYVGHSISAHFLVKGRIVQFFLTEIETSMWYNSVLYKFQLCFIEIFWSKAKLSCLVLYFYLCFSLLFFIYSQKHKSHRLHLPVLSFRVHWMFIFLLSV